MADRSPVTRLALFGKPVKQSLSPRIHQEFASQFGLHIDYQLIEAGPYTLGRKLNTLVDSGARGCNITVPLKTAAWELANRTSDRAQRAQAVNTLVFSDRIDWYGDNTDGPGLVTDISTNLDFSIQDQTVVLVGAGGAARGVVESVLEQQPRELIVANRSPQPATQLVQLFSGLGEIRALSLADLPGLRNIDLLINATSLGHRDRAPGLNDAMFSGQGLIYDMNYGPAAAPLQALAGALGTRYVDGIGMLVEQAAASFALWFEEIPETRKLILELRER